jgi:hypothetical protein
VQKKTVKFSMLTPFLASIVTAWCPGTRSFGRSSVWKLSAADAGGTFEDEGRCLVETRRRTRGTVHGGL